MIIPQAFLALSIIFGYHNNCPVSTLLFSSAAETAKIIEPTDNFAREDNSCLGLVNWLSTLIGSLCSIFCSILVPPAICHSCNEYKAKCALLEKMCQDLHDYEEKPEPPKCCTNNAHCLNQGVATTCNTQTGQCVICATSGDCKDPKAPICLDGKCQACTTDKQCEDGHSPSVYCLKGGCVTCIYGQNEKECLNVFGPYPGGTLCIADNKCGCNSTADCYNTYDFCCNLSDNKCLMWSTNKCGDNATTPNITEPIID